MKPILTILAVALFFAVPSCKKCESCQIEKHYFDGSYSQSSSTYCGAELKHIDGSKAPIVEQGDTVGYSSWRCGF